MSRSPIFRQIPFAKNKFLPGQVQGYGTQHWYQDTCILRTVLNCIDSGCLYDTIRLVGSLIYPVRGRKVVNHNGKVEGQGSGHLANMPSRTKIQDPYRFSLYFLQPDKGYRGRSSSSSGGRPRGFPYYSQQQHQPLFMPFPQTSMQGPSAVFSQAAYPYYGFMQASQPPPPPPLTPAFPVSNTRAPRPFQGTCNICNVYGHKAADCRKK